jgi:putative tryptophan/tyrosine transport system substrate-binding protein
MHNGRNLEITYRWGGSNPERLTRYANKLVLTAPGVLVTLGTAALPPMQELRQRYQSSFTVVSDPVARGFVASLAHPGGNNHA